MTNSRLLLLSQMKLVLEIISSIIYTYISQDICTVQNISYFEAAAVDS